MSHTSYVVSMYQSCDKTYPSRCHSFSPESGHGVFYMETRERRESLYQNGYNPRMTYPALLIRMSVLKRQKTNAIFRFNFGQH